MAEMFRHGRGRRPDRRPLWVALIGLGVIGTAAILATRPGKDRGASTPPPSLSTPAAALEPQADRAKPERILESTPQEDDTALTKARERIAAVRATGDADSLRRTLGTAILDRSLSLAERSRWRVELESLTERLIYDRGVVGSDFATRVVASGDSYWQIARRLRSEGVPVAEGLLERVNGIPAQRLRHGITIKVPRVPVTVIVDKSEFLLHVCLAGIPILTRSVGIGREGRTPEGTYTLGGKAKSPPWTHPETGEHFAPGAAGNQIGSRWIRLYRDGQPTGLGLHGTNDPATIGQAVSMGCIRLRNDDIEALYELLCDDTVVQVRP